jgi:hypothetical protein
MSFTKTLLLLIFAAVGGWGLDLTQYVSARAIAITNTITTPIYCPLKDATTVQVYIRPSSTAQIFTLTFPDNTTVEVPSGNNFTLRISAGMKVTDVIFSAQTATSGAVLQVVGFKEQK